MEQPKSATPLTINTVLDKPYFAFLFEDKQMSSRHVGKHGFYSRSEYYNDPMHRRTNQIRAVYSDYWLQEISQSILSCNQKNECSSDVIKDYLLLNWRIQYPDSESIQSTTRDSILQITGKKTQDGWHWQSPGNHNTPQQLYKWAARPFSTVPDWKDFDFCLINSGWDLTRDGWVSSAYRQASRCLKEISFYDVPDETEFWAENLECDLLGDDGSVDTLRAFENEFPHVECSGPTGYCFPNEEGSLVDHTYGVYNGVIITGVGNDGKYHYQTCQYKPETQLCEPYDFNTETWI